MLVQTYSLAHPTSRRARYHGIQDQNLKPYEACAAELEQPQGCRLRRKIIACPRSCEARREGTKATARARPQGLHVTAQPPSTSRASVWVSPPSRFGSLCANLPVLGGQVTGRYSCNSRMSSCLSALFTAKYRSTQQATERRKHACSAREARLCSTSGTYMACKTDRIRTHTHLSAERTPLALLEKGRVAATTPPYRTFHQLSSRKWLY